MTSTVSGVDPVTQPPPEDVLRVRIAGCRVAAIDLPGTVALCLDVMRTRRRLAIHFVTTHTLALREADEALRAALDRGTALAVPDGIPLVWVGRARGASMGRVCGLDLMPALVDEGRGAGARHYLYGGVPGAAEQLAATLGTRFPGAQFVGTESPPFRPLTEAEEAETVARINAAGPDFVWVGLGTPKQDLWLARFRDRLDAPALLAVGAAFEIVAGTRRRAPAWMQRVGLEWLFRLLLEPRRLWRRYAWGNSRFTWLVLLETVRGRHLRRRRATGDGGGPSGRGTD